MGVSPTKRQDLALLQDVPEPISSSEPADIDPAGSGGGGGGSGSGSTIEITKALYKNSRQRLLIYAKSSNSPDDVLTVTVEGFVTDEPMVYKASKDRYEYRVNDATENLDDRIVTVTGSDGASASTGVH